MRTPLSVIMQAGEFVQKGELDPTQHRLIKMIIVSGKILLGTVNDFIDFALIRENKFKLNLDKINVMSAIDEVIELFNFQV